MKKMKQVLNIAVLLAVLASCVSCSDTLGNKNLIKFSATTGESLTRVSYSGAQISGKERVDWNANDMIWIVCPESQTPASHEAYYVINDITPDGVNSKAKVALYSTEGMAEGLKWNEGATDHHFFAIYPCPLQNNSVRYRSFNNNGTYTAYCEATVPASQAPVSTTANDDGTGYTANPDGSNLIMTAMATYPLHSNVTLSFAPVVTAVEFTIVNGYPDHGDMTLSSIKLSSTTSDIAGKFTRYFGESTATFANAVKAIEIPFTTPVSVAYGKTFTFTVFMLGVESATNVNISDMSIEFVTDATTSIKTLLKTTAGNMVFPRGKKSYVAGMIIPGKEVWTISPEPISISAWVTEALTVEVE